MTLLAAGRPPGGLARFLGALPGTARVALLILIGYAAVAATATLWAPFGAAQLMTGAPFEPPSALHLFGTDNLGRDVFSRVVLGSRPVLVMGLASSGLAVILGTAIGLLLGYRGGWPDEIGMRLVDILMSIPPLVLALLIVGIFGNDPLLVIATVAFLYAPRVARIIRARTLAAVTEDYVAVAVLRGESAWSIAWRELLPEVMGTVFVEFAIRSGFAIVFVGALGFLGFGAPPPTPEWGLMINEGKDSINASLWPVLAPSGAMALLVVALNVFTEGLSRTIGQAPPPRAP